MQNELKQKKILYYSCAYFTNFNYLIALLILSFNIEFDHEPLYAILIWGIPASVSVIASFFIIKHNLVNNRSREQGLIRITIANLPSVIGLALAIFYLFLM